MRRTVKTSHGLTVPVQAVDGRMPDCVVVPAIGFKMPGPLETALARSDVRDTGAVLRQWARGGATMCAACIGTFVMAESGLLDRHQATTTWWLGPLFRQRYPNVLLDESNMLVKSGRFVTAGAALGHMDLALWLVRGASPQLASLAARYLIIDTRPSQSDLRPHRPSRPCRPDRPALRTMGARQVETWVFTRRCGQGHGVEQENPRAPYAAACSGSRRCRIFRACGWNGRCTSCEPPTRASRTWPRGWDTTMARRCEHCCGVGSTSEYEKSGERLHLSTEVRQRPGSL